MAEEAAADPVAQAEEVRVQDQTHEEAPGAADEDASVGAQKKRERDGSEDGGEPTAKRVNANVSR